MHGLQAALERAGRDVEADRLYATAVRVLQGCDGDVAMAARRLAGINDAELRAAVWRYFLTARVVPDMQGIRPATDDGGRASRDTQQPVAPGTSDRGEGRAPCGAQTQHAPLRSDPVRGGSGQTLCDAHARAARPVANPGHARRGIDAIASVQPALAKSLFDTFKLPDGRAIGDVRWGELARLAREHATVSRLLALIGEHGEADPHAHVRDVLTESALKEFIHIAELRNAC